MSDAPSNQTNDPSNSEPTSASCRSSGEYAVRSESRLETDGLNCSRGRVADITGSGMRLIVSPDDLPKVGDVQSYTFADSKDAVTVTGLVKWTRKPTLFTRRGEVGIEFSNLDPNTRQAIISLAVHGQMNLNKDSEVKVSYTDLYKILGVSRYASGEEIQAGYDKNAQAWHPDVSDHPQASQIFDEIKRAYEVLSQKQSRDQYDFRFFGPELDPENTFGDHPGEQAA